MNTRSTIRILPHREANAIATLTLAFGSDPANRWCWPDAAEYLAAFPQFVRALGGNAFAAECAFEIAGGAGAALWLPPGVEPDEAELIAIVQRSVHAARQGDLFELIQQMGQYIQRRRTGTCRSSASNRCSRAAGWARSCCGRC
jgi:hypothetical protein